jgi:methionyl-tRNA formyltransferase
LAELGGKAIVNALHQLDSLVALPQPDTGTTYATKISKTEALLDFSRDASELARAVRAFNPAPGALTQLNGVSIKVWQAHVSNDCGSPGSVLRADANGLLVACGDGALRLTELQPAGGKRQSASQFLAGHALTLGSRFGA